MDLTILDWVAAIAAGILGLGLALWATALWRHSFERGNAPNEYDLFKKVVLFLLTGTIPVVVQGMASSPAAGGLTFALYGGGVGIGFIVGWIYTQGQGSINAGAVRQQYRLVSKSPSNLEVYALAVSEGVDRAKLITGLDDQTFTQAFDRGAAEALPYLTDATDYQRRIFVRLFAGEPMSAISRDTGKPPAEVARDFAELILGQSL